MRTATPYINPMCTRAVVSAQRGFTLVELVLVMVLLGVIAAVAGVRWSDAGTNLGPQADRLASDIRYAQSLAMTHGQHFCINLAAASYQVTTNPNCTTLAALPTEQTNPVPLAAGVALATTNAVLNFDTLGRPFSDAAGTTQLAAVAVITLTAGTNVTTVRVTPGTGRVTVP